MQKYKQEWNPYTGAMETWYWDEATESFVVRNRWDLGDILANNKRKANASVDQRFGNDMMHHVAEIPMGIIAKFRKDYNIDIFSSDPDQQKALMKKLDDPDYRYLKTTVKMFSRRGLAS
jgi:hypothetical protein